MVEVHALIRSGMSAALVKDVTEIVNDLGIIKPTIFYAVPRVYSRIYAGLIQKMSANFQSFLQYDHQMTFQYLVFCKLSYYQSNLFFQCELLVVLLCTRLLKYSE